MIASFISIHILHLGWMTISLILNMFNLVLVIGRGDYRNGDGHSSGAPRPYGGRGRGRGRGGGRGGGDRQDSDRSSQKWGSKDSDNGGGWGDFPGAKVQNSPGRDIFSGSWGGGGSGGSGGGTGWGNWGQGDDKAADGGNSGWGGGGSDKGADAGNSGWGSKKSSDDGGGGGW